MPKKNIELLKRLRTRFLRMRHKKHFDMEDVVQVTECGAAMCIAGHTLDLEGYTYKKEAYGFDWFSPKGRKIDDPLDTAARLLGLTRAESQTQDEDAVVKRNGLFFRLDLKTPKQAAKVIDKIIQDASA
jgi:hypothetical protein